MRSLRLPTLLLATFVAINLCSCRLVRDTVDEVDYATQNFELRDPSERERMLAGPTVLPPPRDVRRSREQTPNKKNAGNDSTLKLLAELCRRQDEYEQVQVLMRDEMVRREQERRDAATVLAEESHKRFAQLEERLNNIDQQITALAKLMDHMSVRTTPPEPTVKPVEPVQPDPPEQPVVPEPLKQETHVGGEDPTKPELPTPTIFTLPKAVAVAEATKAKEQRITIAPRPKRQPRTFSPDAQSLRTKARRAFTRIVSDFPNTDELIDARLSLAQMALEDADIAEALKHYESLIEERPEHPRSLEAYLEAGKLRAEKGDYKLAREHLYGCADQQPGSRLTPIALLEAARTYEHEAAHGRALQGYRDVQNRFPDTVAGREARCARADLLLKLGRFAEARMLYAEVGSDKTPSNPDRTHAWLQTAHAFLEEKRPADARNVLQAFMMDHLDDEDGGRALELYAQCCSKLNEPLDTARSLARIIDKYPTYSKAYEAQQRAGEEFLALELAGTAIGHFQNVLKHMDDVPPSRRAELSTKALLGLARAQRLDGRIEDALATLERLRKESGTSMAQAADLEQAELLVAQKSYGQAAELLGRSASAYPGSALSARALLRKAELEEQKVSPESAVQTFLKLKAAELKPDTAALCGFRRAVCLMHLSRESEALKVLREMVREETTPPSLASLARFQIGLALERQGRLDDALAAYRDFENKAAGADTPDTLIDAARWKVEKLQWLRGLNATAAHADARSGS